MKNLFAFNIKTKEESCTPYIVRSVSSEASSKQDSSLTELENFDKASKLPLWLTIIQYVCLLAAVTIVCGLIKAFADGFGEESFASMWNRFVGNGVIALIIVAVVCIAIFIALFVWGRVRLKKVLASPDFQKVVDENKEIIKSNYEELGIPVDAADMDLFVYPYKYNRRGKVVNGNPTAQYNMLSVKVFKEDDSIYLADNRDIIKIPVSSITSVSILAKRVSFDGWNKDCPHNSPQYKPYKIKVNNIGTYFVKHCYCVELLLDGEEFEIIIPPYECETVEKYLQLNNNKENLI